MGARPVSATSMPLTATAPIAIFAPSAAVTAKALVGGVCPDVASSVSSKTIVRDVPAAGTLALSSSGATMSSVVVCATSDSGPMPPELIAETR